MSGVVAVFRPGAEKRSLVNDLSYDTNWSPMGEKLIGVAAEEAAQKVRFGNFEIMKDPEGRPLSLGKGTFGRTYQARHSFLDTIVALKIITERYATDAAVRQRFLIEARAVAKLSHPHIARLYDFGEMDGVLHYAMEYCGGGSLADHTQKNGALSLRQTLEVGQQIAGALKCAHTAGFIHRDLKPSNIMLTATEGPLYTKLIDFGLVQPSVPGATRSFSDDQSADGARFLGTPLFASPEQLREEPMDVRTDLFSLGMTLWYLLLGGPPETGSSAAIAASRLGGDSYAQRLPANLPPQFRDILGRLLEKDRKNRFGSAAELFAAFNLCATALGFRRARDYTDPASELTEWEEAALEEVGSQAAEPDPIEPENIQADLDSEFRVVSRVNEDFTGLNYLAESKTEPGRTVILHVLHPMLLDDTAAFERLRVHVAQLMALDVPEVLRPEGIKAYSDYVAVVFNKPNGTDLMSILRTGRNVHLIEAAPLLETIADTVDRVIGAGIPGVQLAPGRIFIESSEEGEAPAGQLSNAQPQLYPRLLAVSEAPELARLNEPEDASSTMTTDMLGDPGRADNMCEHFGTLLYRVVAGRNCPMSAALSSQAYVAIPGLSEQANRLLSLVIAKQIESLSCGQVLRDVLSSEGVVPRVAGHPSAGFTARPGSTVSPSGIASATPPTSPTRASTPPPLIRTADKHATATHATPARTWRAPAITPAPSATPVIAKRPAAPVVPPEPPVVPPPVVQKSTPPIVPPPVPAPPPRTEIPTPPKLPVKEELPATVPLVAEARAAETVAPVEAKTTREPITVPPPPPVSPPPVEPPAARKQEVIAPAQPEAVSPQETVAPPPAPERIAKPPSPKVIEDKVSPPKVPETTLKAPPSPAPESLEKAVPPAPEKRPAAEPTPTKAKDVAPPVETKVTPPKIVPDKAEQRAKKIEPPATPLPEPKLPVHPAPAVAKQKRPEPVILKSPPSSIPPTDIEATPPPQMPAFWKDRKFSQIGIGIAALIVVSVTFASVRKLWRPGAVKPKPVAVAPASPAASVAKPAVSTPAPVVSKPAEPTRPVIAGRYFGHLRSDQPSAAPNESERELSIAENLSNGYVIDYAVDPNKQIPLTDGHWDARGDYVARAAFGSANAANSDEDVTVHAANNKTLEVTFHGRQSSGTEYRWNGVLHPWGSEDETHRTALLAEAARKQKAADEAKLTAERLAAAKLKAEEEARQQRLPDSQNVAASKEPTRHRSQPMADKASGSSTTRTTSAPPPPPAAKPAPRPPPAAKSTNQPQQRKRSEFEGSAPGG